MGAIDDELPLPADPRAGEKGQRDVDRVYQDLAARGLPLPAQSADTITRDQLRAHLQGLIGAALKSELTNDPEGRGYTAASNAQKYALLTEAYQVQIGTVNQSVRRRPRIAELLEEVAIGQWAAQIGTIVTNEISNDPEGRGYAGMTNQQRRDALCAPWFKATAAPRFETRPPRLSAVLAGFPFGPNTLTPQQIAKILA